MATLMLTLSLSLLHQMKRMIGPAAAGPPSLKRASVSMLANCINFDVLPEDHLEGLPRGLLEKVACKMSSKILCLLLKRTISLADLEEDFSDNGFQLLLFKLLKHLDDIFLPAKEREQLELSYKSGLKTSGMENMLFARQTGERLAQVSSPWDWKTLDSFHLAMSIHCTRQCLVPSSQTLGSLFPSCQWNFKKIFHPSLMTCPRGTI